MGSPEIEHRASGMGRRGDGGGGGGEGGGGGGGGGAEGGRGRLSGPAHDVPISVSTYGANDQGVPVTRGPYVRTEPAPHHVTSYVGRRPRTRSLRFARSAMVASSIMLGILAITLFAAPRHERHVERSTMKLFHSVLSGRNMYEAPPKKGGALPTEISPALSGKKVQTQNLQEESSEGSEGEDGESETAEEEAERKEEEGESELDEERETEVKVRWGFAFVTLIISFSVLFEYAVKLIRERVPELLQEVVDALLEELTTLGFLGFLFFLFTVPVRGEESLLGIASVYSLHEPGALQELFEGLHYLVFFISLSFILSTIGGLWSFQLTSNKQWADFETLGSSVFEDTSLLEIDPDLANHGASLAAEWKKPLEVQRAEYLRIRTRFIMEAKEPVLEPDFDFHEYLQRRVAEQFSQMIKISPVDWLCTWLLLAVFFGVVEEGITANNLLMFYWFLLFIIVALCLLLQCKMVWVRQQLIPRLPSEMQSSARFSKKIVIGPVMLDQTTFKKSKSWSLSFVLNYVPQSLLGVVKNFIHQRPPNKQERLFWGVAKGADITSHSIRLCMFWTIISLAMLLSHHMPGIVKNGEEQTGYRIFGHIMFALLVLIHLIAIPINYVSAKIFTMCCSIEMFADKEMIEKIVREQKYARCQRAIDMLFMLHFYMQQAKWLKQQAEEAEKGASQSPGTYTAQMFVPSNEEEQRALAELEELFNHFDQDGSGELSTEEVGELLGTMGTNLMPEELEKLVKLMDKDGSGEISLDELASVMLSKKQMSNKTIKLTEVGEELFAMFDKDGKGEISLDEMIDTFESVGKNWDMDDVVSFFELIDLDGSKSINKQEFFAVSLRLSSLLHYFFSSLPLFPISPASCSTHATVLFTSC
eukprot:748966-Hanusia_phi.AAC.2